MIRGVTFDLWDTIVDDDSDEPIRKQRGLLTKNAERRRLFTTEVLAHHPTVGEALADEAFDHLNGWFLHEWKQLHRTPHIADRLRVGLRHLDLQDTPGFDELVRAYSYMEVDIPPGLAPGIRSALEALHGRVKIGIVSDAIVTPGIQLREIIDGHGLLHFFDSFVFSDEAGAAKPDPKVFDIATAELGVARHELVHIGDREYNDINGPIDYGSHAILYTGVIDRGTTETTRASAVCAHHDDLAGIIARLGQS